MLTKEKLLEIIVRSSFTKSDIHRRIRLWRAYLEQAYFGKGKKLPLSEFLEKQKASDEDRSVVGGWGKEFFDSFTKDNAYELTDILQDAVKNLALVNLYVPFEAGEKEIAGFGSWMRENVDQYMLLDVHTDGSVFGGCAVVVDGIYRDYSLRGRLESFTPQIHDLMEKFASE